MTIIQLISKKICNPNMCKNLSGGKRENLSKWWRIHKCGNDSNVCLRRGAERQWQNHWRDTTKRAKNAAKTANKAANNVVRKMVQMSSLGEVGDDNACGRRQQRVKEATTSLNDDNKCLDCLRMRAAWEIREKEKRGKN